MWLCLSCNQTYLSHRSHPRVCEGGLEAPTPPPYEDFVSRARTTRDLTRIWRHRRELGTPSALSYHADFVRRNGKYK